MTECNWFEVPCTRSVQGAAFSQGVQDYVFSVGAPNCWVPSKSYFRVSLSLYTTGTILPLYPDAMTAYADNAVGNLFDNVYVRAGQQDVSSVVQYAAQASALRVRIQNTLPWLRSMGSGACLNQAEFMKRLQACTGYPTVGALPASAPAGARLYENFEIFKPASAGNVAASTVAISILAGTNNGGSVAFPLVPTGGIVTGVNTIFTTGMPSVAGGIPSNTGGTVLPGDVLVVNGVWYEVVSVTNATTLNVFPVPLVAIAATANWFIIRPDIIRVPQEFSSVYAMWQPPLGLFDYSEEMGAGDYRLQLNPNTNFALNAVETRNGDWATVPIYSLVVNDVRFYAYIEKRSIPDSVRDLYLTEMAIQSKPYANNLQFSVPPSTKALTIFFQDGASGSSPLIPPSMFKMLDNTDLILQNIQLTYANITKPSTNWQSSFVPSTSAGGVFTLAAALQQQQRYHDSYEESGLDTKAGGFETLTDFLKRGMFHHFSFEKDIDSRATEVQLNTVFSPALPGNTTMRAFIVAWFRKTVQITTANGLIVNVASREV